MNIFVGNLAFTTTEQDLRQLFEPYGTVETVRIMTDRETGRSRGFGFVEMPDGHAAHSAMLWTGPPSEHSGRRRHGSRGWMDPRHALCGPHPFPSWHASRPHLIPCGERGAAPSLLS